MHFACRLPVGMLSIIVAAAGAMAADWRIEPLGIPINAVNFMNSHGVLVEDADGGKTVYTSYYRSTGAELVGIDFRSGRVVRKQLGSNGGYAIVLGRDGSIYAGGVVPGDLYRYEPASDICPDLWAHASDTGAHLSTIPVNVSVPQLPCGPYRHQPSNVSELR